MPLSEGYVGITYNAAQRWRQHKREVIAGRKPTKLYQLMAKEGLDKFELIVLFSGTEAEMKAKEAELRPTEDIGWNTNPGGGKFTGQRKGAKFSTATKQKMAKAKVGHTACIGTNNPKWKGFYVVNGVEYTTQALAAEATGCSVTKFNKLVKRGELGYTFIPRAERGL